MITWFATGLWHGATWNFIVWGVLNGIVIIVSQECEPLYKRFHSRFDVGKKCWYINFTIIRTLMIVSMLRILDVYRDVPMTFKWSAQCFMNLISVFYLMAQ